MRGWARRAPALVACALALRLAQCASEAGPDDGDIGLPPRIDREGGDADFSDVQTIVNDTGVSPACDRNKPFGTPVRLAEIDAGMQAATPRLSHDERTIYFTTQGNGTELAKAVRSSPTGPFGQPTIMPESTAANENDPSVSVDHLRLFFQSTRNGNSDIFTARRAATTLPFGPVSQIAPVNTDAGESHAYYRQASGELWFVRDEGATGYDIFVSKENGTSFDAPKKVTELSSGDQDWQPQISEDGLTVVFASNRDGGKGGFDLWIARRANASTPFGTPTPIAELNTDAVEFAGWLSADGCRIWFSSTRADAGGNSQLYFAERPR